MALNNIGNCEDCYELALVTKGICQKCKREERKMLEKVKKYLRKNKNATTKMVVDETEVPEKKIKKFIDEGSLIASSNITLHNCRICKQPIPRGNVCDSCSKSLRSEVSRLEEKKEEERKRQITFHTSKDGK